MIVIIAFILGAILGALRAKKSGGKTLDLIQYGAIYGIIFALIAIFSSIFAAR